MQKKRNSFWYNLGMEVGGPLYMVLYIWLFDKIRVSNKKIYFLSKSGYYLYRILKNTGYDNMEYLPVSKADIVHNDEIELNEQVKVLLIEDSMVYDSDFNGGLQYLLERLKICRG